MESPLTTEDQEFLSRFYRGNITARDNPRPEKLGGFTPREQPLRKEPYYICQVCFADVARFPREKHHDFRIFGWIKRVTYITPMVCPQCRMMRQPEVTRLGDGRRRFWKRVISLYLNEPYPSAGPGMARLFLYRMTLSVLVAAVRHLNFRRTGPRSNWTVLVVIMLAGKTIVRMLRQDLRYGFRAARHGRR